MERYERLIITPDWFHGPEQRFPDLRSVVRREFASMGAAEEYADLLGVIARYGNSLLIANFVSETLTQLKERNLALPLSVLVDRRFFASLGQASSAAVAMAENGILLINPSAEFWQAPVLSAHLLYAGHAWSTPHPCHPLLHEMGHLLQTPPLHRQRLLTPRERTIAVAVSRRAGENREEFVAEVFVGRFCGVQYDSDILALYRRNGGIEL